jgi:hypothetical protein
VGVILDETRRRGGKALSLQALVPIKLAQAWSFHHDQSGAHQKLAITKDGSSPRVRGT